MKWFKKKKRALPEDTTCRNCSTQTVGQYCHECGQDVHAGVGQSTLKLIGQALESVFALDGKTPRTLAFLMIRPGFLSEEYRMGKVNRYVHPVKLFWMSSLIFFALFISQINFENGQIQITGVDIDSSMFVNYFAKFAPYVTFLLIPIFALLLALFFWRRKYYYMYHMIFTLHFHTFLWIFLSLLLIVEMVIHGLTYPTWLKTLLFFTPGVYLTMALRRYYRTKSWWKAVWKAILISLLYFFLILLVTGFIIYLVAKIFFPEQ